MTAFDLVPVVIGEYENHRRLDRARDEAERVAGLLAEHLESRADWWTAEAQRTAREWFERYPKAAYMTEVESWRVLEGDTIEFTMRRLPSAD